MTLARIWRLALVWKEVLGVFCFLQQTLQTSVDIDKLHIVNPGLFWRQNRHSETSPTTKAPLVELEKYYQCFLIDSLFSHKYVVLFSHFPHAMFIILSVCLSCIIRPQPGDQSRQDVRERIFRMGDHTTISNIPSAELANLDLSIFHAVCSCSCHFTLSWQIWSIGGWDSHVLLAWRRPYRRMRLRSVEVTKVQLLIRDSCKSSSIHF